MQVRTAGNGSLWTLERCELNNEDAKAIIKQRDAMRVSKRSVEIYLGETRRGRARPELS